MHLIEWFLCVGGVCCTQLLSLGHVYLGTGLALIVKGRWLDGRLCEERRCVMKLLQKAGGMLKVKQGMDCADGGHVGV